MFRVVRGGEDGTTGSAGPPKAGAQAECPCAQPTPAPTPADPAGAPAAPKNVTAALQPNGDVRIEWDDNAEPDLAYYAVRWSVDKSKPQDQWTRLPQNWTTSEATHAAAPANATVSYYVTAVDDGKLTAGKPQVSARS